MMLLGWNRTTVPGAQAVPALAQVDVAGRQVFSFQLLGGGLWSMAFAPPRWRTLMRIRIFRALEQCGSVAGREHGVGTWEWRVWCCGKEGRLARGCRNGGARMFLSGLAVCQSSFCSPQLCTFCPARPPDLACPVDGLRLARSDNRLYRQATRSASRLLSSTEDSVPRLGPQRHYHRFRLLLLPLTLFGQDCAAASHQQQALTWLAQPAGFCGLFGVLNSSELTRSSPTGLG